MRINDRCIESLNAILNSFTYNSSVVEREIYNTGMNHILLSNTITPQNRELITTFTSEQDISRFSALIASPKLRIDTEDGYIYDCILTTTPSVEHIGCDYYKAVYPLSCIKKGHTQRIKLTYPFTNVKVLGNQPAYPIISLIPNEDLASFTVCNVIIRNLKANKAVVINSADKLIEESGTNKFNDCDIKKWISLQPGMQRIDISSDKVKATLEYDPIYM